MDKIPFKELVEGDLTSKSMQGTSNHLVSII